MPEKEKKRRISKEKLKYLKNHLESRQETNTVAPSEGKTDLVLLLIFSISFLILPCAYLLFW